MYIQYLIVLQDSLTQVNKTLDFLLAFLDSDSKINAIYLTFIKKLDFAIRFTNVSIQKIDNIIFEIYKMKIAVFSVIDQAEKIKFFKKIFLIVNISPNVVFKIPFFTLNNSNVNFLKRKL